MFQGEAPRDAYIVKKGTVKVYNLDGQGREQLIYFNSDLDVFPFAWIMGKAPSALYFYEAFTDVEVYQLPRERFVDFLRADKDLLFRNLEMQAARDHSQTMRLNALIHSKASDKLAHTLQYLIQNHGIRRSNSNTVTIGILLTQQDFANLTGLTRETTAVELGKLKKRGVIAYKSGGFYQINLQRLQRLLSDQFMDDLDQGLS